MKTVAKDTAFSALATNADSGYTRLMPLKHSVDLLARLVALDLDVTARDPWWWPHSGSFAMVVSAILTQQSRYQKVEESLRNLRHYGDITPQMIAALPPVELSRCIRPSGFYRVKAERLQRLARAILAAFGTFDVFRDRVDRGWLLRQPGIGNETADAVLCYGCFREAMVVDAYTQRLLAAFDLHFNGYEAIQSWLVQGIEAQPERVKVLFGEMPRARVYALYHGLIVEYAKRHSRGREVDVSALGVPG